MNWKQIIAATSSLLYLILISLFFYHYRLEFVCSYESPCVRFCSKDIEKFSDKTLYESLKKDNLTRYYDSEFDDMTIYREPPSCSGRLINVEDVKIDDEDYNSSSAIPLLFEDGNVYFRGHDYSSRKNCLQQEDESEDIWTAMVCVDETMPQPSISLIMTVISIIILLSTLAIYLYFSELHDCHGKMIILFLTSVICTYFVIPGIIQEKYHLHKFVNLLLGYGFTSAHLWLNSMILNNYFRCRDFKSSKPKEDKFKAFAIYVSIFTSFAVLFLIFDMLLLSNIHGSGFSVEFISVIHYYLVLNDFVVLIITAIIIRNTSKQIEFTERVAFEKEIKLFWIYVKLFAITSLTWSIQIYALRRELNIFGCLTATFIMLFSAVNLCGLFIGRRKVRNLLFDKYNRTYISRTEHEF